MSLPEGTSILGLSLDVNEHPVMAALEYTGINFIISSVVPIPLAGTLVAIGVLMCAALNQATARLPLGTPSCKQLGLRAVPDANRFGIVGGMVINVISSTLGAFVGSALGFLPRPETDVRVLPDHTTRSLGSMASAQLVL